MCLIEPKLAQRGRESGGDVRGGLLRLRRTHATARSLGTLGSPAFGLWEKWCCQGAVHLGGYCHKRTSLKCNFGELKTCKRNTTHDHGQECCDCAVPTVDPLFMFSLPQLLLAMFETSRELTGGTVPGRHSHVSRGWACAWRGGARDWLSTQILVRGGGNVQLRQSPHGPLRAQQHAHLLPLRPGPRRESPTDSPTSPSPKAPSPANAAARRARRRRARQPG